MEETPEIKTEGKQEQVTSPVPVASITETASIIERAENVAKRIEEANKRAEELVNRNEAVAARIMLSGKAEAGAQAKTPAQTEQEKVDAQVEAALKRYK